VAQGRREELLERSYAYVRAHGISELSLRPLASAVGSSPRVLLFLFGSKDGLVKALLARARTEELALIDGLGVSADGLGVSADGLGVSADGLGVSADGLSEGRDGLPGAAAAVWGWLSDEAHRPLLRLWVEAYARSLTGGDGPWAGFAEGTVTDWLAVLAAAQPEEERDTPAGVAERTAVLAVLRGALLDLLATGDLDRTTAAVHHALRAADSRT
jgi:AcrR family transcriptional regulator